MALSDFIASLGHLVGSFQKAVDDARISRPEYIGDMARDLMFKDYVLGDDSVERRHIISSWVFSAVAMIAGEVASSKLSVIVREGVDSEPVQAINHPFEILVKRPNPFMSRSFLWFFTTFWLKLNGNAYWFLLLDNNGEIVELWPLPASDVLPMPSPDGKFLDYYEYQPFGKIHRIPPEYIVHFYNIPNPFNPFLGISELVAASLPSESDQYMSRWTRNFFSKDNVMPSAIINVSSGNPKVGVARSDIEDIKRDLRDNYSAYKRKTLVTSANGLDVKLLGWSPREMDFVLGRKWTRKEVYEVYGLSEGLSDAESTEANARIADRRFRDTVWARSLTPIAEQITTDILLPYYGPTFEATFGEIRPGIREMELLEIDRAKGALTVDEVRKRYWKLPELSDSDVGSAIFTGSNPMPRGLEGGRQALTTEGVRVERPLNNGSATPFTEELKRWRSKAIRLWHEDGDTNVEFTSEILDPEEVSQIRQELALADDLSSIKSVFAKRLNGHG